MRIRCQQCHRIRVHWRESLCKRCWKNSQPAYRVIHRSDGSVRVMATSYADQRRGCVKGADILHATGKAHRWTSETARAAALRMWKLNPVNKPTGLRLGRPAKNRPRLDRGSLRTRYASTPGKVGSTCIWCVLDSRTQTPVCWKIETPAGSRTISERAALIRLGHLPNLRGFVPRVVDGVTDGDE